MPGGKRPEINWREEKRNNALVGTIYIYILRHTRTQTTIEKNDEPFPTLSVFFVKCAFASTNILIHARVSRLINRTMLFIRR